LKKQNAAVTQHFFMRKKKREYQSSELVKSFARIHGFEGKLLAFEIKDFLEEYLDESLFDEIRSVNIENKCIFIQINSPLLKNDFKMRRSFYLKKFQDKFGEEKFNDLQIL
jgi:hypothetical protein